MRRNWLKGRTLLTFEIRSPEGMNMLVRLKDALSAGRPVEITSETMIVTSLRPSPLDAGFYIAQLRRPQAGTIRTSGYTRRSLPKAVEANPDVMSSDEFRVAMQTLGLSVDGMARRLEIGRRQVAYFRKSKPVPPTVALAVRHLLASHWTNQNQS